MLSTLNGLNRVLLGLMKRRKLLILFAITSQITCIVFLVHIELCSLLLTRGFPILFFTSLDHQSYR